ncbi:hypothetical protein FHS30_003349 [Simiduia aestuariiviva]|uniref:Uncharacterized protein n=1 Tax=Simiduia aestuariiviva TaxID=1510459 RepID=A0A839UQL3_9GAMM|nr:hypothetical protein [Simiduia aestuariiviva]
MGGAVSEIEKAGKNRLLFIGKLLVSVVLNVGEY